MATKEITSEQFWKLQEKLPPELKDALWSAETGDDIHETIKRHGVGKYGQKISWLVGQVLLGLLLPQELSGEIKKLGVKEATADIITKELNRLIFYPVKPALEQLHQMEIKVTAKVVTPSPKEEKPSEELSGPDRYREEIE